MKALVLAGGGTRGSFTIGVLKYLLEVKGYSWDLISGVSAGALNGSFLAQYNQDEQYIGIKKLEAIWRDIRGNQSIYKPWLPIGFPSFFGYIASFWTGGIFSTEPLKNLIKDSFDKDKVIQAGNKLLVGAVSLQTGKCEFVEETNENLLDYIVASSAYPVAFPPVSIGEKTYIDGGMRREVSPLEIVLDYNPTEIDIILTNPIKKSISPISKTKYGALGVAIRTVQILNEELFPSALIEKCIKNGIKVRVFAPKENLNVDLLNFSPKIISNLIDLGFETAKNHYEDKK